MKQNTIHIGFARTFALMALVSSLITLAQPVTTLAEGDTGQSGDTVPTGFTEKNVATVGGIATSIALTPDNKLFVGTQGGVVSVYAESVAATTALNANALTLTDVCSDFERGLESIAVDPDYATNKFVYLYYTYNLGANSADCSNRSGIINRVVRYTFNEGNNTLGSPQVILNNIASVCGNHNGGDLHFGADGLLYVSVGDSGGCFTPGNHQSSARWKSLLNGKVLRINKDGSVPASNPFYNEAGSVKCSDTPQNYQGGTCKETFAWGFRNPFRFAIKHGTNQLYVNDVGQNTYEEISEVTAGNDYGWDCREGMHTANTANRCNPAPANMIDPMYEYTHSDGCSITGGAFIVSGGVWPAPYDGAYLFGDYCKSNVFRLVAGTPYTRQTFATRSSGTVITLMWDATADSLYYSLSNGQVWRVRYSASSNRPPTATIGANPTSGPTPLNVSFSSTGSSDPDGDTLAYGWNFGDGATSTSANPSHTYNAAGTFTATLVVSDSNGAASQPAQIRLSPGNTAPNVQITSPVSGTRFTVGQVVTLTATATDAEDGDVASTLQWKILLVHVSSANPGTIHTHPFFNGSGNNVATSALPAPEDEDAAPLSYLEIQVTASDSTGLTTTVTQKFEPKRVTLTYKTQPANLTLNVNNLPISTTKTVTAWQGQTIQLVAPGLQRAANGTFYKFADWSNGGDATQSIVAPGSDTTYTANYDTVDPASLKQQFLAFVAK